MLNTEVCQNKKIAISINTVSFYSFHFLTLIAVMLIFLN